MELEKIRNFSDSELITEEKKAAEQLFRLRFQVAALAQQVTLRSAQSHLFLCLRR